MKNRKTTATTKPITITKMCDNNNNNDDHMASVDYGTAVDHGVTTNTKPKETAKTPGPPIRPAPVNIIVCLIAVGLAAAVAAAGSYDGLEVGGFPVLSLCVVVSFGINWVVFVVAFALHSEKFYDLTGMITYLSMAAVAFVCVVENQRGSTPWRTYVLFAMLAVWSMRLGLFLFRRAMSHGDSRFDEAKHNFTEFLKYWTLQALWCVFTACAALTAITADDDDDKKDGVDLDTLDPILSAIGIAIWCFGFGVEVIADAQKTRFKSDPENKGKFIQCGLWGWSRHPNYFGEATLWLGVAVLCIPALHSWQFATVILSPLFVFLLLRFGSGVPILEAGSDLRWGGQADYEAYKKRVPIFCPNKLWC
eukprot:PhM_4_TR7127/c0_g1_i1/m.90199